MKPCTRFLLILAVLPMLGCRSVPPSTVQTLSADEHLQGLVVAAVALPLYAAGVRTPHGPPILATGSDTEIRRTAAEDARADIDAGQPRICYAGTRGVFPMGVPNQYVRRVESLKRIPLPCGCTDPLASKAMAYAEAYNREIVHYLSGHE